MGRDSNRVYSTETGRLCPQCQAPVADCRCRQQHSQQVLGSGKVRVGRESKGRRGKEVTVISGLPLNALELASLAKELKQVCGCGGTVRDGLIEIQGDHRDRLLAVLQEKGYQARSQGG